MPQPSRDEFYHGCPIPGRASLMRHLDKCSPQALLLQELGPHNPEPTDFGELCLCQGPCQGGPERPAQAAGDWGSQVPPGSLSHAGAHGPFSPFNSQHQSPWGAILGDGGSLPRRHPTLGWQHLVVLNPFCPVHLEVAFPHHFFPLDVCSDGFAASSQFLLEVPVWSLGTFTETRLCCYSRLMARRPPLAARWLTGYDARPYC